MDTEQDGEEEKKPDDCALCLNGSQHPMMVFLEVATTAAATDGQPSRTRIGMSRHPMRRAREKSRETKKKSTSGKRRVQWQLELVIAPFYGDATAFKEEWKSKSRTPAKRIGWGIEAALEAGKEIYARDVAAAWRIANKRSHTHAHTLQVA